MRMERDMIYLYVILLVQFEAVLPQRRKGAKKRKNTLN